MKTILNNRLAIQVIKFSIVGVLAFGIDYGVLIICKEQLKINLFISTEIAFVISVIVNYFLSVHFVFEVSEKNHRFISFLILSIMGLLLTELIMYIGVDRIEINYLTVKIIATTVVMIFNFVTRKLLLER